MLRCAHLTDNAPLLKGFYNDNPMEINEMRVVWRFTILRAQGSCSRSANSVSGYQSIGDTIVQLFIS